MGASSEQMLQRLRKGSSELLIMERRLDALAAIWATKPDMNLYHMKVELVEIDAQGNRLLDRIVDDVYAGGLTSGKLEAQKAKTEVLRRIKAILTRVVQISAAIRQKSPAMLNNER